MTARPRRRPSARSPTTPWHKAAHCNDPTATRTALRALGESARIEGRHEEALRMYRRLRTREGAVFPDAEIFVLQATDNHHEAERLLTAVTTPSLLLARAP
ncbi:hypothetical protein ACWCQW_53170 [Streptomyces mirabilis]